MPYPCDYCCKFISNKLLGTEEAPKIGHEDYYCGFEYAGIYVHKTCLEKRKLNSKVLKENNYEN